MRKPLAEENRPNLQMQLIFFLVVNEDHFTRDALNVVFWGFYLKGKTIFYHSNVKKDFCTFMFKISYNDLV